MADKWAALHNGVVYRSNDWGWASATVNPGVNDYRLDCRRFSVRGDAATDKDLVNPGKDNGPGLFFRKSGDKGVLFNVSLPCGGWAASGRFFPLGVSKFPGRDCLYALSKDTQKGDHHLTVLVKGDWANCYVDGELACILDLSGYANGEVGLSAYFGARFTSFTVSKLPKDTKTGKIPPCETTPG